MPQIPSLTPRFAIYTLAGSILGAALFSVRVWAASAPVPNIEIDVKKTETKATQSDSTDNGGDNGGGKGGGGGGGPTVNTRNSEIYYIITLHNNSNFAASNVEVDYTIYNRTRVTAKGQTTINVDDITGSETVDIPANSSKDVETTKVPHQVQQMSSSSGGGKGKKGGGNNNKNPPPVTVQDIAGIWAQVKVGDTVVQTYEDPMDIKAKMESKNNKSSGDSMDDFGTSSF